MTAQQFLLGLQLGADAAYLCALSKEGQALRLLDLVHVPLDATCYTAALGFNMPAIANKLKEHDKAAALLKPKAPVILCYDMPFGLQRCEHMAQDRETIQASIYSCAKDFLTLDRDDAAYVYQSLGANHAQHACVVYAILAKKKIDDFLSLAALLSLEVSGVELGALANLRALTWQQASDDPCCYISEGSQTLCIHIYAQSRLLFAYAIYMDVKLLSDSVEHQDRLKEKLHLALESFYNLYPQYQGIRQVVLHLAPHAFELKEQLIYQVLAALNWVHFKPDQFFFKQKPAYEILRSDWSSDVCSSD
eukprot:COSAG04_NODE_3395_length_2858_cov_1.595143_4_plen_305_part_01